MNIISTTSNLPWTPANINGMLSIIFIGPDKFNPNCLDPMFQILKHKVYPEDGTLLNIDKRVVEDTGLDA